MSRNIINVILECGHKFNYRTKKTPKLKYRCHVCKEDKKRVNE